MPAEEPVLSYRSRCNTATFTTLLGTSGYDPIAVAIGNQNVLRFSGLAKPTKTEWRAQTGTSNFVNGAGKLRDITGEDNYKRKGAA